MADEPECLRSKETRRRMSEANRRRPPISEATRRRLRISHLGKKLSKEQRLKIGASVRKACKERNLSRKWLKKQVR